MNIFLSNQHLSIEALQALIDNSLNHHQERLQVAEHLSECELCLEQYLQLQQIVQQVDIDVTDRVMGKIYHKQQSIRFGKYVRAAAAVVLALGLWNNGIFFQNTKISGEQMQHRKNMNGILWNISQGVDTIILRVSEDISDGIKKSQKDFLTQKNRFQIQGEENKDAK